MTTGPVLKWPGSKFRLGRWVCDHLPAHEVYLEPFFGSGAVFFTKEPAKVETVNDLNAEVVNLFRMVRERGDELAALVEMTPWARAEFGAAVEPTDDSLEAARRFLVRSWQAFGMREAGAQTWKRELRAGGDVYVTGRWRRLPERLLAAMARLRGAQIECRPALGIIAEHRDKSVAIYADPPYVLETRSREQYRHEMADGDHAALLAALEAHPGPVLLTGYRCPLYDERLGHWTRVDARGTAEGGRSRVESLWLNGTATRRLRARQLALVADCRPTRGPAPPRGRGESAGAAVGGGRRGAT